MNLQNDVAYVAGVEFVEVQAAVWEPRRYFCAGVAGPNDEVSLDDGMVYTFNRTNRHDLPRSQLGGDKTLIDGGAIDIIGHIRSHSPAEQKGTLLRYASCR